MVVGDKPGGHQRRARLGLLLFGLALAAAFILFDLERFLSLSYLKESRQALLDYRQARPLLTAAAFFFLYAAAAALSLPGAAVMSMAGGGLFGFWLGLGLVSFASSIGALLAFGLGRYLFRDWIQHRFGGFLGPVNRGVEKEGAFYLFTLRLVPVFPFFLVNLLMALTPIRPFTFYWVSQAGMLAGTALYVNAGKQLGRIESLGDVLSWELGLSFVLLGLFPLLMKKGLDRYRRKRRTFGGLKQEKRTGL